MTIEDFKNDLVDWIDGDIIKDEFIYCKTKQDLDNYSKKFGDSIDSTWNGQGNYVYWSWGDEHIDKIDVAYTALIDSYNSR